MFSLVGKEVFNIGKYKCAINVEALETFLYEYTLEVNGKSYEKFREEVAKKLKSWTAILDGQETRICLGILGFLPLSIIYRLRNFMNSNILH